MTPYEPLKGKQKVVIVDIDGTVAQRHDRDPYDMTRVLEDTPIMPVIQVVWGLKHALDIRPVFVTARHESGRKKTEMWLRKNVEARVELHMRADGDGREDEVVKLDLFDKHIRHNYDVVVVLDDRPLVVDMWRSLGLTCLQVDYGEF